MKTRTRVLPEISNKDLIKIVRIAIFNNSGWTKVALVSLYEKQTSDEVYREWTEYKNFVGFTKDDAVVLTRVAEWTKAGMDFAELGWAFVQICLTKYARQLTRILDKEILRLLVHETRSGQVRA